MTAAVGVDLGATNVRAVVAREDGSLGDSYRRKTPEGVDGSTLRAAVVETVESACDAAGVDLETVDAAGVATVGPIDDGAVMDPVNLPAIDRLDLVDPLAESLGADVSLMNDATAGAIAEAVDREAPDLVYLTLSTGVGAGVVAGGRPLHGHRSNAGEVGHVTLDPDADRRCGCGGTGHWEAFCGGANLVDHARSIADEGVATHLDLDDVDPRTLLEAAGGDPLATELADRIATWNALGVATVVHAYDPAVVVVGGGVALNHQETVVAPIRARLPAYCLHEIPRIEEPEFGADAPVVGALEVARPD